MKRKIGREKREESSSCSLGEKETKVTGRAERGRSTDRPGPGLWPAIVSAPEERRLRTQDSIARYRGRKRGNYSVHSTGSRDLKKEFQSQARKA